MADLPIPRVGIYCIRNLISGRCYVGSSVHVAKRWRTHRDLLERGSHHARTLQRSWRKHGAEVFEFTVLEAVAAPEQLVEREQFWIDHLHAACPRRGFNSSPTAGNCLGVRHSDATKAKHSANRRGVSKSAAHRKAIGDAHRGRKLPEDHCRKIAENTRRFFAENPQARERMREVGRRSGAASKGRKLSAEHCERQSRKRKGDERFAQVGRDNLARITPEQAALGRSRAGMKPGTPLHERRRLTFEQAQEVRRLKAEGWTYDRLAARFHLNRVTLFHLVKRRTYQRP